MTKNDAGEEQPRGNEEQSKWNERQEEARAGQAKNRSPPRLESIPGSLERERKREIERKIELARQRENDRFEIEILPNLTLSDSAGRDAHHS